MGRGGADVPRRSAARGGPHRRGGTSLRLRSARCDLPGQPNGRTGWVRRATLGESHITHTALLVDKSDLRATIYKDGEPTWSAPVGIGTPATPTPNGRFYVRELIKMNPGTGAYGPYIYGTSGYAKLSERL